MALVQGHAYQEAVPWLEQAQQVAKLDAATSPTGSPTSTETSTPAPSSTSTQIATATTGPPNTSTPMPSETSTPTATPQPCVGDCDGNLVVSLPELVRCLKIANGDLAVNACSPCDGNADGIVDLGELVRALKNANAGCPLPLTLDAPVAAAARGEK